MHAKTMPEALSPVAQRRVLHILGDGRGKGCQGGVGYIRSVKPLLQNGPQCGLVALKMIVDACKLPGPNLDEILKIAKQKGYTKYGEMFSADWLADIVISLCPTLDVEVQNLPSATQMEHLIQESAYLLIPYDCDKNHEPSFFAGHSAHWCVVVGFFCPVSGMVTTTWNTMTDHICSKDTLVFCVHGKSRHLAVWNYSQLIASNLNIREATNRVDDFVIPSTDLSTLRNRCLVIRHRLKAL